MAYKALAAVALGAALAPLDTAVNIAFPAITEAFAVPVSAIQWIVVCYVLTYASLLLNFGRWADISGHRKVFLLGLVWSIFALILCALAPAYEWLLFFRILQGIGSAMVLASGPALVTLAFAAGARSKAVAAYGFFFAAAFALGPLIGGVIVEHWGWAAVFWFRVPLAGLALLLSVSLLTEAPPGHVHKQHFDVPGGIALSCMIVSLLLAVNRASAGDFPAALGIAAVAAVAGVTFIRQELRCAQPVFDLALFRYPLFSVANLANVLNQLAAFVILLLCPYYLVPALQADIGRAGFMLSLSPLAMMLAAPLAARLCRRFSAHLVGQLGSILLLTGIAGIGFWSAQPDLFFIAACLLIQGLGLGLFQVANMDFVMGVLPREAQGVAGSLVMLMRTIGVVIGASAGAMLFALLSGSDRPDPYLDENFIHAFSLTFWAAAAVSGLAWVLTLFTTLLTRRMNPDNPEKRRRPAKAQPPGG